MHRLSEFRTLLEVWLSESPGVWQEIGAVSHPKMSPAETHVVYLMLSSAFPGINHNLYESREKERYFPAITRSIT